MRHPSCSLRTCLGIGFLVTLEAMFAASSSGALCYSTPRGAIEALIPTPSSSASSETDGYRVTRIDVDRVLARRWAMIARCDHPEWPAIAFPAGGVRSLASQRARQVSTPVSAETPPLVRAGDVLRLWKQESSLRIEVAAVSEESGGLGKTIHVRLLQRNIDNQALSEQFSGIIRGPLDVEMQSR